MGEGGRGEQGCNCVLFKQMYGTWVNLLRGQSSLGPHPVPGEEVESASSGAEWGTGQCNVQDTQGRRARGRPWLAAERRENKMRGSLWGWRQDLSMGFSTLAALESHLGAGTWWLAYRSQESHWAVASLEYPQVQPGQRTTVGSS